MEAHSSVVTRALVRVLTPLVRILLRNGCSCGAFEEILRRVYVDVADRDFGMQGRNDGERVSSGGALPKSCRSWVPTPAT